MSNDEALKIWRSTMKRLDFLLTYDGENLDEEGNMVEWYSEWIEEHNSILIKLEKSHPHLIDLASL